LNVVNSYVGRNFMTSIADRNQAEFIRQAMFYVGVFAASTLVSVSARFAEDRIGLLWREFLSRRAVGFYLADKTSYHWAASGDLANPDQRIAEDIRAFTVTAISFVVMTLNGSFTVLAFSGVLWAISPLLFIVAVLYAACGSYLAMALGRPMITLNYDQLDKEASFRSGLIHVQENAESIMLARREGRHTSRLLHRVDELIANLRRITAVNRNVGFFTTGYNWLIQIIPALIIAPSFIRGEIDFGVITQSAMAFSLLVGAFSLIVNQFQSISNFTAVVSRLSSLVEAIEQPQRATTGSAVEIANAEGGLAYERVTLLQSTDGTPLIKDLAITIPSGTSVLVTGSNQAPGAALFRATAGVPTAGVGRIVCPGPDEILFLAQMPYLPPGTLRQVLVPIAHESEILDERILELLRTLKLERVLTTAGGLDAEQNWETQLSLREQQLLAFVHVLLSAPQFVFLDRISTTLGFDQTRELLKILSKSSITYVTIGETDEPRDLYDAVLEIGEDGSWTWTANGGSARAAGPAQA
jgi:vitamin B12/bleomycin/antimicrobial peptide transport system ATP-binding/permease protein